MSAHETPRQRLQGLIPTATRSDENLEATLEAILGELDRLEGRVDGLENARAQLAGSLPMPDGSVGRSDETTA